MKVVEVIPVSRGIARPSLSYFTKEQFAPGSFVRIPLRKGSALGIIVSSKNAREVKTEVKGANFVLKKLTAINKAGTLNPAFMQAVQETAAFHATTPGSALSTLVSKIFLDYPELLPKSHKTSMREPREARVVALGEDERFREYRSIVRESFARGKSVLFLVSTQEEVLKAEKLLSSGIERYVFSHKSETPKKVRSLILSASEEKHPILFITTPAGLPFDRQDLDTYILERENSRAFRSMKRPFINIKVFLEYYVRARGSSLIMGDSILSLDTLHKEREGHYSEFTPINWRLKHDTPATIVDMREKKEFQVISPELREMVEDALSREKKIFIFAARKGLSPSTVCDDCGSILLCKNCSAPLVLHKSKTESGTIYICHHCGMRRPSETRCDGCDSWKLTPLGLSTERVAEEFKKEFLQADVFILDKDHASTRAKTKSIIKKFLESKNSILVGTEQALGYLTQADLVAVTSLDSLFSIPDFGVNERIFYLVTRLREMTKEKFILQTRNAGKEILSLATNGNALDFYRSEIAERKELFYPPFSLFVKVSTEGSAEEIRRKSILLQNIFVAEEVHFMKNERKGREASTLSMIFRIPRETWPRKDILEKLLLLTPDFTVKVDPESIL